MNFIAILTKALDLIVDFFTYTTDFWEAMIDKKEDFHLLIELYLYHNYTFHSQK